MKNIVEEMNILEQTPIKEYTTLSSVLVGFGIVIMILSLLIFIKRMKPEKEVSFNDVRVKKLFRGYAIGIIIAISASIHFPWFYAETGRYNYKCELEDGVSANYVGKNFNIISVEDNVWIIEDK